MARRRRVVFGRVNRRRTETGTDSLDLRPLRQDMESLAESKQLRATVRGVQWVAGDFGTDASGDFMTGTIGFTENELRRDFDEETQSWIKGPSTVAGGASKRTVVPFAMDTR